MKKLLLGLGVVVIVVVLLMATGVLKLSVRVGPPPASTPSTAQPTPAAASWRTYTSKDWGYVISYPPEWVLREQTSGARDILLTHPSGDGFVRIFATLDPAVNSEAAMQASLKDYEASFTGRGENLLAFKSDIQGTVSGFMAAGKMKLNATDYVFKERGLMSVKGRVLIMRGAAIITEQKTILPIAEKIMDSFQAAQ